MIGDWVLFIALPLYTYSLTQSSLAMGTMFIAGTLPRILFGSLAGVFVDRWDRQRTMVIADLSRALLLLLLLFVRSPGLIWIVYIVAFLQATISQFFDPAENALLPQLVDSTNLVAANSLNSLNNNLARLGGPALGGILLGLFGFTNVVLVDSLSFLISGMMIAMILQPSPALVSKKSGEAALDVENRVWQEWLSGLGLIVKSSAISMIFLIMCIAGLGEGLFNVMFVIFVQKGLGGGALEFGWLTSAQAVGGLIGGLIIGWIGNRISANQLVSLIAVNGLLIVLLVNLRSLPIALVLILLAGIPIVAFAVGVDTLLQRKVADQYRGRVFGALGTSVAVFVIFGQGWASILGDQLGAVSLLSLKGLLDILGGLIVFFLLYKINPEQAELNLDRSFLEEK